MWQRMVWRSAACVVACLAVGSTRAEECYNWVEKLAADPIPREGVEMVFDAARNRLLLFGGAQAFKGEMNDTWAWDGSNWTRIEAGGPPPRASYGLAYDSRRDRVVLFGGSREYFYPRGDTWEFDGENWTEIITSGPPARKAAATRTTTVRPGSGMDTSGRAARRAGRTRTPVIGWLTTPTGRSRCCWAVRR